MIINYLIKNIVLHFSKYWNILQNSETKKNHLLYIDGF